MAQVIIGGKIYTIYEMCPQVEIPPYVDEKPRNKKEMHRNRLNMARSNYRKK